MSRCWKALLVCPRAPIRAKLVLWHVGGLRLASECCRTSRGRAAKCVRVRELLGGGFEVRSGEVDLLEKKWHSSTRGGVLREEWVLGQIGGGGVVRKEGKKQRRSGDAQVEPIGVGADVWGCWWWVGWW